MTGDLVPELRDALGRGLRQEVRHFDNGCPDCFGTGADVYMDRCPTCKGRPPADRSTLRAQNELMRGLLERLDGPEQIAHPQRLIRNVMNRVRDLEAGAK